MYINILRQTLHVSPYWAMSPLNILFNGIAIWNNISDGFHVNTVTNIYNCSGMDNDRGMLFRTVLITQQ